MNDASEPVEICDQCKTTARCSIDGCVNDSSETVKENMNIDNIIEEATLPKPPLGVVPENIWKHERINNLINAISRYNESEFEPKAEWYKELGKLLNEK